MKKIRGPNGGARPGAGRKPKVDKYIQSEQIVEHAADELRKNYTNIRKLADGQIEITHEEWAAAGAFKISTKAGTKPIFQDSDPKDLILIRKRVSRYGPNLRANEYLTNRVMGRPPIHIEVEPPPLPLRGANSHDLSQLEPDELTTFYNLLRKCSKPADSAEADPDR